MYQNDSELLDRAAEMLAGDRPEPEAEEAILRRVEARVADYGTPEVIDGCGGFAPLLGPYRRGELPEATVRLVRDHLRGCPACRNRIREAVVRPPLRAVQPPARRIRWWRAAAAAALVAVAWAGWRVATANPVDATVAAGPGTVHRLAGGPSGRLALGDRIRPGDRVRIGREGGALLSLADGSTVELAPGTEIVLARLRREIGVAHGAVLVHAAPQLRGRLHVRTRDCGVTVHGTTFVVEAGLAGSRVGVVEGEVAVRHGNRRTLLEPGQTLRTGPAAAAEPVVEQVAWSRDADRYRAMLRELAAFQREVAERARPFGVRYRSRLARLMPENTVLFLTAPDLPSRAAAIRETLEHRLETSETLARWWRETIAANGEGDEVMAMLGWFEALGRALGEEGAIAVTGGEAPETGATLLAAEVRDPAALAGLLENGPWTDGDEAPALVLLDDASAAVEHAAAVQVVLVDDLLLASREGRLLREAAARASGTVPPVFPDTPLGRAVASAYARGVTWLAGLDGAVLRGDSTGEELPVLERLGVANARTLVLRLSETDGLEGVAAFDGPRAGAAAWLAPPGPMGSLEFVSPRTVLAAAALTREGAAIVDDVLAILAAVDPDLPGELRRFEAEHGIDVHSDLGGPLGGEVALALDTPLLPVPSWKLVVEVRDPATLEATIERLVAQLAAGEGEAPTVRELPGEPGWHALVCGDRTLAVWTYAGGYLVAGPAAGVVHDALDLWRTGSGLPASAAFRDLLPPDAPLDCSAVVYHDLDAVNGALGIVDDPDIAPLIALLPAGPGVVAAYGEQDAIVVRAAPRGSTDR